MADPSKPFDAQAVEALKAIGKTLGQMSLYRVGHPAVAATLQDAYLQLGQALSAAPGGEVAYSLDADKLIANGRVVGAAVLVPNAIVSLFTRYRLNSITFRSGIDPQELTRLCELAGMRVEQAKGVDAAAYLKERGVTHILLNEAFYAKVDKATAEKAAPVKTTAERPPAPGAVPEGAPEDLSDAFAPAGAPTAPAVGQGAAAGGAAAGAGGSGPLVEQLAGQTIEGAIETLVRTAVPDPKEQSAVYEAVFKQLQAEIQEKVRKVTQSLHREKMQLQNEQVRTQTVLSNMAEGVVVVDDRGNVLMMNPAAEELYGVKLVEVAGKPLAEHVKDEHLLTLAGDKGNPDDRPIKTDVEVLSTDDTRRTVRASAAVVQNEAGKTVGMVSALTDLAKHKEFDRMEREFVAHVTHELRAPLSSIRASLEILQGQFVGRLEADDERIFNTALKNTDRLEDLIRNILDFSKIESGQMTVHQKPSAADQIAKEGVESLRPWCQKKGINLVLNVEDGLPQVDADPPRTVQVMVNLLSNAIKFTPSGGHITVRVAKGAGKYSKFVQYAVSDTGPGIAKPDQEKIFEKFVQIAAGEKHVGGTGLGLAIAKALIHLQTGQMWVESELGKGATFNFTLPIYVSQDVAHPSVSAPKRAWWKRLLGLR